VYVIRRYYVDIPVIFISCYMPIVCLFTYHLNLGFLHFSFADLVDLGVT
jgi:hypothetical protein